ncbi:diacylglycerol kinase family lipid kinase [Mucilaginibacter sp. UR6-1]|uniref:diacylglycerol/lipid kinase family protein n=1 Tax=Mucilaginibacter sp. UR6-1 TaxID=1435643 RepID=UPI001E6163F6|nr:diacylglycerol kinase family protein [Mucilaginibacter sp. UR6-1]MCC8409405.1 diacylglycerol kinase family lipid kinase [Mucilaginibacter sp. UR6-1]
MKKKVLFIVNPVSGGKKKDGVPQLIRNYLDTALFDATFSFSEGITHARELAKQAIGQYDVVVAVGGDGTVNEVASAIVNSDTALGIIPFGSGNGLSRFLGIPMDVRGAVETFNKTRVETIDSALFNGQPFFNMAGLGFDAHISNVFAQGKNAKKRGFYSYFKSSVQEILNYKSQSYHIAIDGREYDREAFMLSFANSSQFGNNAHVSPKASVQDGMLDVCVVKPFPLYKFPEMALRMFNKTADKSPYVEIIRGKRIHVTRTGQGPAHLDGEPQIIGTDAEINIIPRSLNVIVGEGFVKGDDTKSTWGTLVTSNNN